MIFGETATSQSRDLFTSKASIESADGVLLREQHVNHLHNRESYAFNATTITIILRSQVILRIHCIKPAITVHS